MMASLSGTLATMGPAVPYANAAKLAYPDRPVIAFSGDGAAQMIGNAELVTTAKYWRRWSNPTFVLCVFKNRDLNQVTWEQRVLAGDPRYVVSQDVPDFPFARYAELLGLTGVTVDDPEELGDAWERVLAADRPALLEVVVDPEVPPLPPHITVTQAEKMAEAMIEGDPERVGVLEKSLLGKLEELKESLPGRS